MELIKMNQHMLWHLRKKKPYRLEVNGVWTDVVIHLWLTIVAIGSCQGKKKSPLLCQHTGDSRCVSTSYTYRWVLRQSFCCSEIWFNCVPTKYLQLKIKEKLARMLIREGLKPSAAWEEEGDLLHFVAGLTLLEGVPKWAVFPRLRVDWFTHHECSKAALAHYLLTCG